MRIAIIDDETHCIQSLVFHLENLFPEISIVYKTTDPREALSRLPEINPDLLFLDVEMPVLTGFELLEQMGDRNFDVIFTTAYSQYAVQAFKAKAINYLLKPIAEEELKEAINQWKEINDHKENTSAQKVNDLLVFLKKEGVLKNKIALPVADGIEFIDVNNIMYCKSQSNYTNFHLSDGEHMLLSKTISEVEKLLVPYYFIRTHRSFLINPNFMKKYFHSGGGFILMQDDQTIPVSNQHKKAIRGIFTALGKEN